MLMVSTESSYNSSNATSIYQVDFNTTTSNITLIQHGGDSDDSTAFLDFVILPLVAIVTVIFVVGLVTIVMRKKRLDKLRHHLMPLYSFDPAEEGEDWEAELLEEGTDHQHKAKTSRPSEQPQLSFRSNL
ncbi:hypothetical protein CDAR_464181 [Caerostris darwini]|uniref:Small integral membrane protein 29 n=1 Tax=Caerostris darwini TaxID=1538125 RepID=A0AAV4VWR4_9ARAC|nr:hypothetical protein CDAR_464181 [Caerostris darwini]